MSSALANGLAGAGGGLIAQILTYPLQTVNTRQQTERVIKKGLDGGRGTSPSRNQHTLVQLFQVIKTEGWGGLYSGLKPSLIGTIASQPQGCVTFLRKKKPKYLTVIILSSGIVQLGVYYYFYQVFKNRAESVATARKAKGLGDGNIGMISWLAVAAMAGCLNVLLTNPMWVLVTRMQTQTQAERNIMERKRKALLKEASHNSEIESTLLKLAELESSKPKPYGTLQAAGEIYSEAGIRGFWKGLIPTLIMVCNPSIQFMIYETSLRSLKEKRATTKLGVKQITALEVFFLGAVAKLGATVTTYPLLVVKSRLQAKQDIGSNVSLRYSGTLDAIVKMIRYEGFMGFYKGMSTKIVQSVFAASVLFMVKEELVKAFMILAYRSRKIRLNALR